MTDYEVQSLAATQHSLAAFWMADIVAAFALLVAVIGGIIAWRNLRAILGQLDTARWNSLLSFEQDMAQRRSKFIEIAAKMQTELPTTMLKLMNDEARESYFNSLDRLASSILNGQFPDAEMRQDYEEVFTNVVREFPDDFGTGTRYRKIVRLYNRWKDR